MERVDSYSLISFKLITIGGITETSKGFYLPKIKFSGRDYRNIKDGVAQLTRGQAEAVILSAYYNYVAEKKGWSEEVLAEKIAIAQALVQEKEREKLATELMRKAVQQQARERDLDNPTIVEKLKSTPHTILNKITTKCNIFYRVKVSNTKGEGKLLKAVDEGCLPNQKRWKFENLEDAMEFIEKVEKILSGR